MVRPRRHERTHERHFVDAPAHPRHRHRRRRRAHRLDVAFGDALTDDADIVDGCDDLAFCGMPTPSHRVYPRSAHIAEKLHAYTLPHGGRENSRVKDLPDIALLATLPEPLSSTILPTALEATFAQRKTHELPTTFPSPPASWRATYATMAKEFALP